MTDPEFVAELRVAVERYLEAVDRWEAAYQRYYRLPGYQGVITEDMAAEHRDFVASRRALEEFLPQARRLCHKYGLRDAFSGLPRVSLGQFAPQQRTNSAIGRNERGAATKCLLELDEACRGWTPTVGVPAAPREEHSLLRRVVNFFY